MCGPLPVTRSVAGRILSLPLFDAMEDAQVFTVVNALREQIALVRETAEERPAPLRRRVRATAGSGGAHLSA